MDILARMLVELGTMENTAYTASCTPYLEFADHYLWAMVVVSDSKSFQARVIGLQESYIKPDDVHRSHRQSAQFEYFHQTLSSHINLPSTKYTKWSSPSSLLSPSSPWLPPCLPAAKPPRLSASSPTSAVAPSPLPSTAPSTLSWRRWVSMLRTLSALSVLTVSYILLVAFCVTCHSD